MMNEFQLKALQKHLHKIHKFHKFRTGKRLNIRLLFMGMAAVTFCLLLSGSAFAGETGPGTAESFYLRYISPEDMAVSDYLAKQRGPDFYFDGLKSDDIYRQYFSINKLVEYFNDDTTRLKAIDAVAPFLDSQEEKLSAAASFTLSILKKDYSDPNIYHLANGAVIFTLFNNYSDYGSYNQVWMIKDDQLTKIIDYSLPKMYISQILLSPDRTRFAVVSCSNKSQYITVYDPENQQISPELVDSTRFMAARDKGYTLWQREDFENYSGVESCHWTDNDKIEFNASLAYDGAGSVDKAVVTYHVKDKTLGYQRINQN